MSVRDDAGREAEEGFVDVVTAFPSDTQAFHAVVPGDGSLDHPPELAQTTAVRLAAASYMPVLTTMTQLPNIAANIAAVQAAGPNHYGQYPDGVPLTRGTQADRNANYKASCKGKTAPPGSPGTSCDEYPFASTRQGASFTMMPDWGIAWVPGSEQSVQGGLISAFYKAKPHPQRRDRPVPCLGVNSERPASREVGRGSQDSRDQCRLSPVLRARHA
jgi:hypothetical protein